VREFGRLKTAFWHNPKIKSVSERARLLACYLISCPHGNALGCFILSDEYIAGDFAWPVKTARDKLAELISVEFCERDIKTNLLRILPWWEHNTLENPKVCIHAITEINRLPSCQVKERLLISLDIFAAKFSVMADFMSHCGGNSTSNGHGNGMANGMANGSGNGMANKPALALAKAQALDKFTG